LTESKTVGVGAAVIHIKDIERGAYLIPKFDYEVGLTWEMKKRIDRE
jgi:hypothetical protein